MPLLSLFSLIGWSLQTSTFLKRSLEVSMIFISSTLIVILYLSGLAGLLKLISFSILIMGLILFLRESYFRNYYFKKSFKSLGFIFFLFSSLLLFFASFSEYYKSFTFVDDFSHWARVSKLIVENGRLLEKSDPVWFGDYPPGSALFNYFFLQVSNFSPGKAMFAQGVFVLIAFSRLFSVVSSHASLKFFLFVSLFIFLKINFFGHGGFHTLSVDMLLGLLFGISLFSFASDRLEFDVYKSFIIVLPIIFCLPLIKSTGVFFSFVILSFIAVEALTSDLSIRGKFNFFGFLLLASLVTTLIYLSWNLHVISLGIGKTFNTNFTFQDVLSCFGNINASERYRLTIETFKRAVFTPYQDGNYLPYYWLFVIISFLTLLWNFKSTRIFPLSTLLLGFLAYLLILLLLYLFAFGSYEGVHLASMGRYLNSYVLGIIILLFGLTLQRFFVEPRSKLSGFLMIFVCCIASLPNLESGFKSINRIFNPKDRPKVSYSLNYANFVNAFSPKNSKVYFLLQGTNGTENTIFNYGVLPRDTNRGCWSVGEIYFEGDVWTCPLEPTSFLNELSGYDYLFVGYVDEKFNGKYSEALKQNFHNGDFYKIIKREDKLKFNLISQYKNKILVPEVFTNSIGR